MAPPSKKPRLDQEEDDPFIMDFEEDIAPVRVEDLVLGDGPQSTVPSLKWCRPELSYFDPLNEPLIFQQIDIDFYIGSSFPEKSVFTSGQVPIISMYGITMNGNSVAAHIHGFLPYFYVPACPGFRHEDCQKFKEALNLSVINEFRQAQEVKNAVVGVDMVLKQSILGYQGNKKVPYLKITLLLPKYVSSAKRVLESGFQCSRYGSVSYQCYESNIDFDTRFMVDLNIQGCSWVEFSAGRYQVRHDNLKRTRCQIEVDVSWHDIIAHPVDGDWSKIAPFQILSFDIECAGRKGVFPEPEIDPVIQIACIVQRHGDKEHFAKVVLTLESCAPIVGAEVMSFKTEGELLNTWSAFVRQVDPDIITGYNIQNFDLTYLLNRAKHLGLNDFPYLGRVNNEISVVKSQVLQSTQLGKRENKLININGRVQFDLLLILLRDYKLRSYQLNAVSYYFLQEQKEDIHHSIVTDLQNGDEQTRKRLAIYCLKDAVLPLRIIEKLMCFVNYVEMARVTGVTLGSLLSRGQQIMVMSQLLRKANECGYVIPVHKIEMGEQFTGATVIEPERGYYNVPIATLNIPFLYPTIMMAHNLCYTTLLTPFVIEKEGLTPDQYIKTPSGNYFAKSDLMKGLLPEILENLLSAIKRAKMDLENETDPFKRQGLEGRQRALEISAASVYGFTGAQVGKLPCLEISQSVTAFGRLMIEQTKEHVEEMFTCENGYPHDAKVIYGDTNLVMCKFGVPTIDEAMKLGREAAEKISSKFQDPIKVEFEKVYFPYLLINKKRYAGLYFTKPEIHDKMDSKGIETVRRDNCPLVANLINSCLHKLLVNRDPDGAVDYAKQVISDLLCNRIDISQLIITKELTRRDRDYAVKQAHVELAHRMRKRDPGSAPQCGDRVPYVIIAGTKKTAAYEKAEEPLYVLNNNIAIDTNYYLENQIKKPLLGIFGPILGDKKAESVLFVGDHTRTKTIAISSLGGLSSFTTKKETCVGCKTPLDFQAPPPSQVPPLFEFEYLNARHKNNSLSASMLILYKNFLHSDVKPEMNFLTLSTLVHDKETARSPFGDKGDAICKHCKPSEAEIYLKEITYYGSLEEKFSRLWTQCQTCQGSRHEEILCTSRDCPIFYMRTKVKNDLNAQGKVISRFDQ